MLWSATGTVIDTTTGTFAIVVPAGTMGCWPRRCRWAIYFDADGGGEAELLAEGHLHVRPMVSRAHRAADHADRPEPGGADRSRRSHLPRGSTIAMSITTGTFPGVRIVDMPDLGAVTDNSSFVGEHAGSGRFTATALCGYITSAFGAIVSVKSYGAVGDGVTNDTSAITAAINACASRSLFFPKGIYLCDPVTFSGVDHVRVFGEGRWASQIKVRSTGVGWTFSNCQGVNLERLSFEQNTSNCTGVRIDLGSSLAIVDDVRFAGFGVHGLEMVGTTPTPLSGSRVTGCLFLQNQAAGLYFDNNNDFWVRGNQFGTTSGGPPDFGCLMESSSAGTYSENYHWGNTVGLRAESCNYNRYVGNRFEQNKHEGVALSAGADNIFMGNTIHTNSNGTLAGFNNAAFTGVAGLSCIGNQSFDFTDVPQASFGFAFGINCSGLTIKGNQISDYATAPYFFDPSLTNALIASDQRVNLMTGTTVAPGATAYLAPGGQYPTTTAVISLGEPLAAVRLYAAAADAPGAGQTYLYPVQKRGGDGLGRDDNRGIRLRCRFGEYRSGVRRY